MKLLTKLILFISGSKLVIALIFILILPFLVEKIASEYTNFILQQQKEEVLKVIKQNGLAYYFQGDNEYGSYTMLKEEYIALEPTADNSLIDTIKNAKRVIENDTLNYRVLSYTFKSANKNYLLEIGKTTSSINQYNKPLQRFTLYLLISLIAVTLIADLTFIRLLISPLDKIIKARLLNRKFPFKDKHPKVKTNTTDFRYLDESLTILMRQVNEAFEKEKEFTANASHELMTPISILQSKMENLLRDEELNEKVAFRVVEMMKTLDRLKKISSSLLLISRIDNEQFIKKDVIVPTQIFAEIIEEIEHRLAEKNIKIVTHISKNTRIQHVNKDLLFHLFYNLINNAIKFNIQNGKIEITAKHLPSDHYEIVIRDTGIGIPASQLPFIFDRFRKTNLSENIGYGLGLAIVKSIASYHDIQIDVQSEVNNGTIFRLLFPKQSIQ